MQALQYAILFAIAIGTSYLAFWQPEDSPQVSSGIATLAWTFLIPASGSVTRYSGGEPFTAGSLSLQAFCLILALLSALTLVGAVTGRYPTDSMRPTPDSDYE